MSCQSKKVFFGIDPSSTCCGLSVFLDMELVSWEVVHPPSKKVSVIRRCFDISTALAERVRQLSKQHGDKPTLIVEIPGKQGGPCGGGQLLTLGIAVGMVLKHLQILGHEVQMVEAAAWTRLGHCHCLPKETRARMMRDRFKSYSGESDPGMDGADAIGLAAWYIGVFPKGTVPPDMAGLITARSQRKQAKGGRSRRKRGSTPR